MTKILFLGDIFGKTGRLLVRQLLPSLIVKEEVDLVLGNGENAAGGVGLTIETATELFEAGLSAISGGNHTFKHREIDEYLNKDERLIRPSNYPDPCPGRGWTMLETATGKKVAFGNLMGRIYMPAVLSCPFRAADLMLKEMTAAGAQITIIDFHAEATSEKKALGWYLDGRLGALVGTHTHVQTSDSQIFPLGLAYLTDAGMTGPHLSVIGMGRDEVLQSFLSGRPHRFSPSKHGGLLEGVLITFNRLNLATEIKAIREESRQV
jgi:metallophosphoesterase (TIGR00282 family)